MAIGHRRLVLDGREHNGALIRPDGVKIHAAIAWRRHREYSSSGPDRPEPLSSFSGGRVTPVRCRRSPPDAPPHERQRKKMSPRSRMSMYRGNYPPLRQFCFKKASDANRPAQRRWRFITHWNETTSHRLTSLNKALRQMLERLSDGQ